MTNAELNSAIESAIQEAKISMAKVKLEMESIRFLAASLRYVELGKSWSAFASVLQAERQHRRMWNEER
jgi:ribosomal protein S5